jgi:predicted RNA binding protein YcfA (HicA-like mRNA interferase family)
MRIPRDLSGADLVKALRRVGYETSRQTGSHIRLVTNERGQHHVTVPNHSPIKIGTLSGILSDVASHLEISRDELVRQLFAS